LQIIGGGKMGQALLWGLKNSNYDASELVIVDTSSEKRDYIASEFPGIRVLETPIGNVESIIAVKPQFVAEVCDSLDSPIRIISIAAGVPTSRIQSAVGEDVPVLRAMPNTPALVNSGMTCVCKGPYATEDDLDWACKILSSVGEVLKVKESEMDAVTGMSGSGPAYIFKVAEAMAVAGETVGLSSEVAVKLANRTLIGAAKLLDEPDADAVELRKAVTTPNGTTEAGINVLEQNSLTQIFTEAVIASTQRSREIGEDLK